MWCKNTKVTYEGINGVIDFVCDDYVVIELPAAEDRNSPRILVLRGNYKNIHIEKASTK